MKAYLQVDFNITELELFMQYVEKVPALIEKHEGRYLVKGVEPIVVQSDGETALRSVVIEFPSMERAQSFIQEREDSGLVQIWKQSTRARISLLEGCTE